ncbi:hypothetical protein [Microcoleus sp. PH2017_27_LUM_O_A]|nr:hypothetical protein [Microcoleus sp. PH2017_27_LUM_O_A]
MTIGSGEWGIGNLPAQGIGPRRALGIGNGEWEMVMGNWKLI